MEQNNQHVVDEVYYSDDSDYESENQPSADEGIIMDGNEQDNNIQLQSENIPDCKWANCTAECSQCYGWYIENSFEYDVNEIEGMEMEVLQGVENLLGQNEPEILEQKGNKESLITPPPEYLPQELNAIGDGAGSSSEAKKVELSRVESRTDRIDETPPGQFDGLIPAEFKWTSFDECVQDIVNPKLADRMRRIRTGKWRLNETDTLKEAALIWAELREKSLRDKFSAEKKNLISKLKEAEKRADKYYMKWNAEVVEKERINNGARQLNTSFINYQQELTLEQARTSTLQGVCRAWRCLCLEKDEEITRMREHNVRIERKLKEALDENISLKEESRIGGRLV